MQEINEVIVKLELAENLLKTSAFMESSDADSCLEYVNQTLTKLRSIKAPEPTEFTKEWRERLENAVALFKIGKNPDEWFQSIITGFREACKIINQLQTENAKLIEQAKTVDNL